MPGHCIGMYGICPASAITQVGTAWDAIQINALLLQLRLVTVANVGLQPQFCSLPPVTVYPLCLTVGTCSTSHCGPFLMFSWELSVPLGVS